MEETNRSPVTEFDPTGSAEGLLRAAAVLVGRGARGLQVLGTVASVARQGASASFDAALRSLGVPVFGGLFPRIVLDGQSHELGTVVVGHAEMPHVEVVECAEAQQPAAHAFGPSLRAANTVVAYVDATAHAGALAFALFDGLGGGPSVVGGGAGSLDFVRRPVIVTPDGLREGVAVVAGLSCRAAVGVTHGWEPLGEPLLVTEAEGPEIVTLDWRPALEVYREVVEAHSKRALTAESFYELASRYPLMLEVMGAEGVVRDPLTATPDGRLRCAGDVQPNASVRVANGDEAGMFRAAELARTRALASPHAAGATVGLTIDCISRALLLGERLPTELAALRVSGLPQVGALTIGELASSQGAFVRVHNKTTVLALLSPSQA